MADFIQGLDPSKLVLVETVLSFIISPFDAPPYNLAIFLFGSYAQENPESTQSLQTFTGLLSVSAIFDIVWMARNHQSIFVRLITILILILKLPAVLAFGNSLRQRGSQFSGLGIRGGDLNGATVWSMPGGFTSAGREGYQAVDEESTPQYRPKPPQSGPPKLPSSPPQAAPSAAYQAT